MSPLRTTLVLAALLLLGAPLHAATDPIADAEAALDQMDAAAAGLDTSATPDQLAQKLAAADDAVSAWLKAHGDDAHALVISARIDRALVYSRPQVSSKDKAAPTLASALAPAQKKLDRAIALKPDAAEAYYWKARLYGVRQPAVDSGAVAFEYIDLAGAIQAAREAVKREPNSATYREALALYLYASGDALNAAAVLHPLPRGTALVRGLLTDILAIPMPPDALPSPADSESYAQQQMQRGRFQDYPQLRVRFFVVKKTFAEIEAFYATRWPGFKLIPGGDPQRVGDTGAARFFGQDISLVGGAYTPIAAGGKLPDKPGESDIVMAVIAFSRIPPEVPRRTPAGMDVPASFGDSYCFMIITDYRTKE